LLVQKVSHFPGHFLCWRSSTAIWCRSAIPSNSSSVRVRGPIRVTGTAPLVSIAMKAGYRQALETINEFARTKF